MQLKHELTRWSVALPLVFGVLLTACSSSNDTERLNAPGLADSLGTPSEPSPLPPEITEGTAVGSDADPENVVTNGSFEKGLDSWPFQGDTVKTSLSLEAYTGSRSMLVEGREETWHSITQELSGKLVAGEYYAVSAWMRVEQSSGESAQVDFIVRETLGETSDYIRAGSGLINADGWTKVEGVYRAPAQLDELVQVFYIELPEASASYYVDDILIKPTTAPSNTSGARVGATRDYANNGSVEQSLNFWHAAGDALLVRSNARAFNGDYSVQTTTRTRGWEGPNSRLGGLAGTGTYVASIAVRLADGTSESNAQFTLKLPGKATEDTEAEFQEFSGIVASPVSSEGWTVLRGTFDFPSEDIEDATVYVELPDNASDEFYVDNLRITQLVGLRNLTPTGDAESGTAGWGPNGNVSIEQSSDTAYQGAYSILTSGRTQAWNGPSINLGDLSADGVYKLSGWLKLPEGTAQAGAKLSVKVEYVSGEPSFITVAEAAVIAEAAGSGQTDWVQLSGTYTHEPDSEVQSVVAYFELDNATTDFYVDEFTMVEANAGVVTPEYDFPAPVAAGRDGLAGGQAKYLGSAISDYVPESFAHYWNQLTPENSSKWGEVEAERDVMDWAALDLAYAFAKANQMPFKLHTLIWGSQAPDWLDALTVAEQRDEIEEWFAAVAQRYPEIDTIDVVNEALKEAVQVPFKEALGGDGETGFDWVVTSFELARQYFPVSKLLINDYGIVNDQAERAEYLALINILQQEGLVDGIGLQGHYFNMNDLSAAELEAALDELAEPGLPLHISELDLSGDDAAQAEHYQRLFPVIWEHSAVAGVTVWAYVWGETWRHGDGQYTALLDVDGNPRPALSWLEQYFSQEGGE